MSHLLTKKTSSDWTFSLKEPFVCLFFFFFWWLITFLLWQKFRKSNVWAASCSVQQECWVLKFYRGTFQNILQPRTYSSYIQQNVFHGDPSKPGSAALLGFDIFPWPLPVAPGNSAGQQYDWFRQRTEQSGPFICAGRVHLMSGLL